MGCRRETAGRSAGIKISSVLNRRARCGGGAARKLRARGAARARERDRAEYQRRKDRHEPGLLDYSTLPSSSLLLTASSPPPRHRLSFSGPPADGRRTVAFCSRVLDNPCLNDFSRCFRVILLDANPCAERGAGSASANPPRHFRNGSWRPMPADALMKISWVVT